MWRPRVRPLERSAHRVGLFCNARDELRIREWVVHHLLLGFDAIFVFDHLSEVPLSHVLRNFDHRVKVLRVSSQEPNIKRTLMNLATLMAKRYCLDWFIYLDADEFLVLNNESLKHLLQRFAFADAIAVNWLMFGSNHHVQEPHGLMFEAYTKCEPMLDQHVKTFVRPSQVKYSDNPHFYHMKNPSNVVGTNGHHVLFPQCFHPGNRTDFRRANAYIAHFVYQSEETYKKRKVILPADDGTQRTDMGAHIHAHHNTVENCQLFKYVEGIKQFLSTVAG